MVETTLTKEMIASGATLVGKLDERNFKPDAAFWLYFPDLQEWKLVIAEVNVGNLGPKKVYRRIQEILSAFGEEIGELSLDDITLIKPESPIVSLLRTAIRPGQEISGIRFKNNTINGTMIEDAYIYRLL